MTQSRVSVAPDVRDQITVEFVLKLVRTDVGCVIVCVSRGAAWSSRLVTHVHAQSVSLQHSCMLQDPGSLSSGSGSRGSEASNCKPTKCQRAPTVCSLTLLRRSQARFGPLGDPPPPIGDGHSFRVGGLLLGRVPSGLVS